MTTWERLGERQVWANAILGVRLETLRAPDGGAVDWTVVTLNDGAAVLAVEDDGAVWMIRQYRPSVGAALWELPAGRVETGEEPLAAARRELAEEAGLAAGRWQELGPVWPLDGIARHRIHHFIARDLRPVPTRHERLEDISVARIPRDELRTMVREGRIVDGVALALLARHFLLEDET